MCQVGMASRLARRQRRRCLTFMPPQIPCSIRWSSAYSVHSSWTGQVAQISLAEIAVSHRSGKNRITGWFLHAAWRRQSSSGTTVDQSTGRPPTSVGAFPICVPIPPYGKLLLWKRQEPTRREPP